MSISGEKKIKGFSEALCVGAAFLGVPLIGAGLAVGSLCGWHATAICLITAGGLCFVPGYSGGIAILERIKAYQRDEEARIKSATTKSLFSQTQDDL